MEKIYDSNIYSSHEICISIESIQNEICVWTWEFFMVRVQMQLNIVMIWLIILFIHFLKICLGRENSFKNQSINSFDKSPCYKLA